MLSLIQVLFPAQHTDPNLGTNLSGLYLEHNSVTRTCCWSKLEHVHTHPHGAVILNFSLNHK